MWQILFLILVLMCSTAFAQTEKKPEVVESQKAVLLEEFGKAPYGQLRTLLDMFFDELQKNPTAHGYIFIYGTKREVIRREKLFRDHVVFRKVDASQITFARGKNEIELKTQFWIVPNCAEPPKP